MWCNGQLRSYRDLKNKQTNTMSAPILQHLSGCQKPDPRVSPDFKFLECLSCSAKHFYDSVIATSAPVQSSSQPSPQDSASSLFDGDEATRPPTSPLQNLPTQPFPNSTGLCEKYRMWHGTIFPTVYFRKCKINCEGCKVLL